jgi:hypothetical protein
MRGAVAFVAVALASGHARGDHAGDLPPLFAEIGYVQHSFEGGLPDEAAVARQQPTRRGATAAAGSVRLLGGLGDFAYTGFELDIGGLLDVPTQPAPPETGYIAPTGVLGVHRVLAPVALSAELAFGARVVSYDKSVVETAARWQAQLRAGGEVFLGSTVSLGVLAGVGLRDRSDRMFAVYLGMHVAPYDHGRW